MDTRQPFSSHLSLTNGFKDNGGRDGGRYMLDKYHGTVLKDSLVTFTVDFGQQTLTQYLTRHHPLGYLVSGQQGQCFLAGVDTLDTDSSLHSQDLQFQTPGRK